MATACDNDRKIERLSWHTYYEVPETRHLGFFPGHGHVPYPNKRKELRGNRNLTWICVCQGRPIDGDVLLPVCPSTGQPVFVGFIGEEGMKQEIKGSCMLAQRYESSSNGRRRWGKKYGMITPWNACDLLWC